MAEMTFSVDPVESVEPIHGGFAPATKEVYDILSKLYRETYEELRVERVSVSAMFAWAPVDPDGFKTRPALKVHGMAALAKIRKTTVQQRSAGSADAEITIDGDQWPKLTASQKVALLDHELMHLIVVFGEDEGVKLDKAGRPCLKLRPHDWELTGFADVVERHGSAALEVKAMAAFVQGENGQLVMGFAAPAKQLEE